MRQATSKQTLERRKIRSTGGLRARAWWVLRKNKHMTVLDIQNTVCDGAEKSAESNLRRWLIKLVAAGILEVSRVDDGKPTSNGLNLYTVVVDVGPVAPIVRNDGSVFDPNSGTLIVPPTTDAINRVSTTRGTSDAVIDRL